MIRDEYADVMRDGFPPMDEIEPTLCEICGEPIWGESEVLCAECMEIEKAEPENIIAYLKSEKQELGFVCWTDFILRELYGITKCDNAQKLMGMLDIQDELTLSETNKLFEYMENDDGNFTEWIEGSFA